MNATIRIRTTTIKFNVEFFLSNEIISTTPDFLILLAHTAEQANILVWLLIFYLTQLKACVVGTGYSIGNHIFCLRNYCFSKNLIYMKYNNSN